MTSNSSNSEAKTTKTRTQRLRGRDFYHGMIQRADVDEILKADGDYLLRKSINQQTNAQQVVLSVKCEGKIKHFIILEEKNEVFFEHGGPRDKDIETLIQWMARKKLPITKASGCIIKRSIAREDWVLTHESITIEDKIGQGQFGEVFRGRLKTASTRGDVAIKVLRDGELIENQKSFLDEARIMRALRDENVIRTYGVAVYEKPLMIVMELCERGSLLKYLRSNRTTAEQKYRWITEAAKGMQYVAAQGLMHRDIAARNCLLTKELVLKIADFGLTIKMSARTEVQGKVPVKWLARETLQLGTYSRQTDVWSYGILCWEVYNDGAEPYPDMTNQEARAYILSNNRMDIPNHIPKRVGHMMLRTWDDDPKERPSFAYIVKYLRGEV